jgi:hypothetical protein
MGDQKTAAQAKFQERIDIVNDAIALREPKRIPICPMWGAAPFRLEGSSYKDLMYNYDKAGQALFDFYTEFEPDATTHGNCSSGRANEIAQSQMIDWPGRPGTGVPDFSTYQVIEKEFMGEEEYPEVLNDFTGFMLRKYLPRAFPALKGLANINFVPSIVLSTSITKSLYSDEVIEAGKILQQIGEEDKKAGAATAKILGNLQSLGFPPMYNGVGEAPFDIIGDYYRGTLATLTDQLDYPEEMAEFCDRLADIQIAGWKYFENAPFPVKRVFFPLHKGMDGFMSAEQYAEIYWKPLKKCLVALIDMGVTPIVYTEGKYNTRIDQLADLPKGKCIVHFEKADMKRAKEVLGDVACISGNMRMTTLEFGTVQETIDEAKELIETMAPGGGYIFDFDGCIDNAKRENLEAMFETIHSYDK